MKKQNKMRFLNGCLLIDNSILAVADFHIGYEEYITEQGISLRIQFKEIIEKLDEVFDIIKKEKIKLKKIVVLGDLKHEFGGISDSEWRETLKLIDYLAEKVEGKTKNKIILTKGNHDNIIGPIARKTEIELRDYYSEKGICFLHGNKIWKNCFRNEILIMGHLHPAIILSDKYKKEKYKCFLYGKWKGKEVYILPSFSPISFGFELNCLAKNYKNEDKGFLVVDKKTLRNFEVVIYNNKEKKEYNFGRLKSLI